MRMNMAVRGLIGLASLVSVGACSALPTSAAKTAGVRPIEEILVEAPRIEAGAGSATVYVTTRVPVACAVVYGTTSDYGAIATDTDMAGGAHADHHPALVDLEPGTLYHFRLQGVGPDGVLYRSEEYTFRTLRVGGATGPTNLASAAAGGRVSGVSSQYGGEQPDGAYAARRAIDGDPATQWSSDGDGDEAWIEIELPSLTHVTRVGFWTRTMGSTAQILSFRIVTDQGEEFGPFDLPDAARIYYFDTDLSGKRLRFEAVETTGGNTGAAEIEVYGEP